MPRIIKQPINLNLGDHLDFEGQRCEVVGVPRPAEGGTFMILAQLCNAESREPVAGWWLAWEAVTVEVQS